MTPEEDTAIIAGQLAELTRIVETMARCLCLIAHGVEGLAPPVPTTSGALDLLKEGEFRAIAGRLGLFQELRPLPLSSRGESSAAASTSLPSHFVSAPRDSPSSTNPVEVAPDCLRTPLVPITIKRYAVLALSRRECQTPSPVRDQIEDGLGGFHESAAAW
jgi:hypothetical protein